MEDVSKEVIDPPLQAQPDPNTAILKSPPENEVGERDQNALSRLLEKAREILIKNNAPEYFFDGGIADSFALQSAVLRITEGKNTGVIGITVYTPGKQLPELPGNIARENRPTVKAVYARYTGTPPVGGTKEENFKPSLFINVKAQAIELPDKSLPGDSHYLVNFKFAHKDLNQDSLRLSTILLLDHQMVDPEDQLRGINVDAFENDTGQQALDRLTRTIDTATYDPDETQSHVIRYLERRKTEALKRGETASYEKPAQISPDPIIPQLPATPNQ